MGDTYVMQRALDCTYDKIDDEHDCSVGTKGEEKCFEESFRGRLGPPLLGGERRRIVVRRS